MVQGSFADGILRVDCTCMLQCSMFLTQFFEVRQSPNPDPEAHCH
jgi:hypothetical protein